MTKKRTIGILMIITGVLMLVWVISTVSKEAARVKEVNTTTTLVAVGDAVLKEANALAAIDNNPKAAFQNLSNAASRVNLPAGIILEKDNISFSYTSVKYPQDKVTLYIDASGAFSVKDIGFKVTRP